MKHIPKILGGQSVCSPQGSSISRLIQTYPLGALLGAVLLCCLGRGHQAFEGGEIEHRYIGPHKDTNKTKELQEQGKKINLSLSEVSHPVVHRT